METGIMHTMPLARRLPPRLDAAEAEPPCTLTLNLTLTLTLNLALTPTLVGGECNRATWESGDCQPVWHEKP